MVTERRRGDCTGSSGFRTGVSPQIAPTFSGTESAFDGRGFPVLVIVAYPADMTSDEAHQATQLLAAIRDGDETPAALMPLVYRELRVIAGDMMRRERDDHTLQPTAVVHEVFVRLVDAEAGLGGGRREFLAVAAQAMRNLLVDHARKHRSEKRGGGWERVTLGGFVGDLEGGATTDVDILDLNRALDALAELDPRQAKIVEMCFFAGMTGQEIADHFDVHRNTVHRDLKMARAWLRRELGAEGAAAEDDAD